MARWSVCALALLIASARVAISAFGQPYPPSEFGQWDPAGPFEVRDPDTPSDPEEDRALQPVHMTVLQTGRILCYAHSNRPSYTIVIDPTTSPPTMMEAPQLPQNIFCGAMTQLADGRFLGCGGGEAFDIIGRVCSFDPMTETWMELALDFLPQANRNVESLRYYPTTTILGDGCVLLLSGRFNMCSDTLAEQDAPLLFDDSQPAGSKWTRLGSQGSLKVMNWYPFAFLTKAGAVYMAGGRYFKMNKPDGTASDPTIHRDTFLLNPEPSGAWIWSANVATAANPGGSAVMYQPNKVLKGGGGFWCCNCGQTDTFCAAADTYAINLDDANPAWQSGGAMNFARRDHTFLIMPDGKVLAIGGRQASNAPQCEYVPRLQAEWCDTDTWTWEALAPMVQQREDHHSVVLLPDGRVMIGGGQFSASASYPCTGVGMYNSFYCFQRSIEIFSPPYLFDQNSNPAPRPTITSVPAEVTYNSWFNILTPQAAQITRVTLVRLGACTHGYDQNTRFYEFSELVLPMGGGKVRVQAPPNGNYAPPGYYMLFILTNGDRGGIFYPSVAKMIKLKA